MAFKEKLSEALRFHNPFKWDKCDHCGHLSDPASPLCPDCGHEKPEREPFYRSFQEIPQGIKPFRLIILTIIGCLGFQLLGLLVSGILASGLSGDALKEALLRYAQGNEALAIQNYVTYALLAAVLLLVLWKDNKQVFACFKKGKTYIGVPLGFGLIIISVLWNLIQNAIAPNSGTSENQKLVIRMVRSTPFFAIVITGFVGPLCEEITYRLGLFGFLKRINRIFAYAVAAFIFGAIHMRDWGSLNEWLNFPSYLLSGIYLAYVYEHFGFGASWLAHSFNNLFSVITILASPESN